MIRAQSPPQFPRASWDGRVGGRGGGSQLEVRWAPRTQPQFFLTIWARISDTWWQWLWWQERGVREGQAGQSADAGGPESLATLQGVGPRRHPALMGVPHLCWEVSCELCDSSSSRLKAGGSAPPNTEQGTRGGVRHRQDRLLHFGSSLSREGSGGATRSRVWWTHTVRAARGTSLEGLNVDNGQVGTSGPPG